MNPLLDDCLSGLKIRQESVVPVMIGVLHQLTVVLAAVKQSS